MEITETEIKRFELVQRVKGTEEAIADLFRIALKKEEEEEKLLEFLYPNQNINKFFKL